MPLADALTAALDAQQRARAYPGEDHLVFALGKPIDRSRLLKRYKAAVRRAGKRGTPGAARQARTHRASSARRRRCGSQ